MMADKKKTDKKNYVQSLAAGAKGISKPPESPVKQLWNAAKEGVKGALQPSKTLMKYQKVTKPLKKGK